MRSYIDLINQFWKANKKIRFSPSAVTLYFYLLNEFNESYWDNTIFCASAVVYAETGLNRATITRARQELSNRGFITFTDGVRGNTAPAYTIISDVTTDAATNIDNDKPIDNMNINNNDETISIKSLNQEFINDKEWKTDIMTLFLKDGIDMSEDKIDVYINRFFSYQNLQKQKWRTKTECRKHCINWIILQVKFKKIISYDNNSKKSRNKCGSLEVSSGTEEEYLAPF